jgi:hypothetical protein
MKKEIRNKLKKYYPNNSMGDWMFKYEVISFHELAVLRNNKTQITGESYSFNS